MACSYLKRHGYTILQRDYSNKFGQIDIIALEKKTETVCFVEVKTRTNLDFGPPEQAVSRRQKKRLVRAAKAFLHSRNAFTMPYRFDIIAIDASSPRPELRHFKGAFTPESAFGRRDW
jgi:putative endonuclease